MSRFECEIELEQKFIMAIEADTAAAAQDKALNSMAKTQPTQTKVRITVNQGVR